MARILGEASQGFTLVEIIIVIVVVGILAVVSVARFTMFNTLKAQAAANKIASDIRSTQQLAAATHDTYRISFDPGNDTYNVKRVSDNAYAKDPFTRANFIVDLKNDPVTAGTDITSASFGGTTGLQFDWQAVPQNATGVNLTTEGAVSVSYKGAAMAVYVRPRTGSVRVQ